MHHRVLVACLVAGSAITLSACGGGAPQVSEQAVAQHPGWVRVSEIVCPSGQDRTGSVDEHQVSCVDAAGHQLEAAFYDQSVELDRRVSTFECRTGVKAIAGTDWIVPVVPETVSAALLDSGGINLF